jgi:hypothetical protein
LQQALKKGQNFQQVQFAEMGESKTPVTAPGLIT